MLRVKAGGYHAIQMAKQGSSVELVRIKDLKPAKYNPRAITAQAFDGLVESVRRFGMPQPVVVNKRNNVVVGGHQRLKAAQELGWDKVPVIWVNLQDADERALNVTLNNASIAGHFTDSLQDVLVGLRDALPLTDFEALALHQLEIQDGWQAGQSRLDAIDPNLDGIQAVIKVRCKQEDKQRVTAAIQKAIAKLEIQGASVG